MSDASPQPKDTETQAPIQNLPQHATHEVAAEGFDYPFSSQARRYERMKNQEAGRDYFLWQKEDFDLQAAVSAATGPVLEVAGPTTGGYYWLDGIKLPTKPIITNLDTDQLAEMRPYIDQLADGRNLPYEDKSQGIVLLAGLNFIEEPPNQTNASKVDSQVKAEQEMEALARGTLNFEDVEHSLRAKIYSEAWRVLASGGLFFTNGTKNEMAALQRLGFEVTAYRKEYMKPPEGLGGFEGETYDLVLLKP